MTIKTPTENYPKKTNVINKKSSIKKSKILSDEELINLILTDLYNNPNLSETESHKKWELRNKKREEIISTVLEYDPKELKVEKKKQLNLMKKYDISNEDILTIKKKLLKEGNRVYLGGIKGKKYHGKEHDSGLYGWEYLAKQITKGNCNAKIQTLYQYLKERKFDELDATTLPEQRNFNSIYEEVVFPFVFESFYSFNTKNKNLQFLTDETHSSMNSTKEIIDYMKDNEDELLISFCSEPVEDIRIITNVGNKDKIIEKLKEMSLKYENSKI